MSRTVNVLIVDDRPANLTALEALLGTLGLNLVAATSAEEALRALMAQEFALVLTDVTMPGMSGFELARLLREREKTRRPPIMFLTATDAEDLRLLEGYAAGAVDYLVKPIIPEVLRAKVRVFADLFRHRKALEEPTTEPAAEAAGRRAAESAAREALAGVEAQVAQRTAALTAESVRVSELLTQTERGRRALVSVLEDQQQAAEALRQSREQLRALPARCRNRARRNARASPAKFMTCWGSRSRE